MKRVTLVSAGFLLIMVGIVSADGEGKKVKLSFTTNKNVFKLSWPARVRNWTSRLRNHSSIYGNDVSVRAQQKGRRKLAVTLYCNDISKKITKIYKSNPIIFNLPGKLGEKKMILPLVLDKIDVHRSGTNELYVRKYPGWAMKGAFGKTSIYLIDANLDGQFDTNGKDYIAIGSPSAMKLRKQTSINGKFYNTSVTSDGSELTLKEFKPEKLCKVRLKKRFHNWQMFALSNSEGMYNIAARNCDILPAGEYRISYGLYGKGANTLCLSSRKISNQRLDIRENSINTINIGAPFSLSFMAKISSDHVVSIDRNIYIVGCHGEVYRLSLSSSLGPLLYRTSACPLIRIFAGKKEVSSDRIGDYRHYSKRVPRVSRANGSVLVVRKYPAFGRLCGKVRFREGEFPLVKEKEIIEYKPDGDKEQTEPSDEASPD